VRGPTGLKGDTGAVGAPDLQAQKDVCAIVQKLNSMPFNAGLTPPPYCP
jgi:hypothetical protein